MNRELLFPTPIYTQEIPDYKNLNKDLLKNIKAWSKKTLEKPKRMRVAVGIVQLTWVINLNTNCY